MFLIHVEYFISHHNPSHIMVVIYLQHTCSYSIHQPANRMYCPWHICMLCAYIHTYCIQLKARMGMSWHTQLFLANKMFVAAVAIQRKQGTFTHNIHAIQHTHTDVCTWMWMWMCMCWSSTSFNLYACIHSMRVYQCVVVCEYVCIKCVLASNVGSKIAKQDCTSKTLSKSHA